MNDEIGFSEKRSAAIRSMLTATVEREHAMGPRKSKQHLFVAGAVLAAVVVGTGGTALALNGGLVAAPAPVATPTDHAAPSATAVPTPTEAPVRPGTPPAPPAVQHPTEPSSWLIDFGGIGPATLGASLADERPSFAAFADVSDAENCPGVAMFTAPDAPVLWLPLGDDRDTIQTVYIGGNAEPLAAAPGSPRTAEGIGIGSSRQEVEAAYPDLSLNDVDVLSPYYSYSDDAGRWITIQLQGDTVAAITVQPTPLPASEYCG